VSALYGAATSISSKSGSDDERLQTRDDFRQVVVIAAERPHYGAVYVERLLPG
jgi:hypothetical protein